MEVRVDNKILFPFLDELLARWKEKKFPYNKPNAVIPQTIIPDSLRQDKRRLACFYFYVCIYMRGGIESLQAFNALIRMWREHPDMFDPHHAQWQNPLVMQRLLKTYIGWDSVSASISWVENSRRLAEHWGGNPLNLLKGLRNYDEAARRVRNKKGKRELKDAGLDGIGFRGFQYKMVSMLIYFYDWEGWIQPRFLYPAPADFHNFRLGFNQGAITLTPQPENVRVTEKISEPWRRAIMAYLRSRNADPVELADAIWLFSLVMCGESPLNITKTKEWETNGSGMFSDEGLPHDLEIGTFYSQKYRRALKRTCMRCPVSENCNLSIPAGPYYRRDPTGKLGGVLVLRKRYRIEDRLGKLSPDMHVPASSLPEETAINLALFEPDE